jgi:integrase
VRDCSARRQEHEVEKPRKILRAKGSKKDDAPKAGNGQGSVYPLGDGRYRWQVTLGYELNGKRRTASGVSDDKTQAGIAKAKALADFSRGLLGASDNITLSAYAEIWLNRQKGLSPNSLLSYRRELGYALGHLGKLKLKNIKPHHAKDCMLKLSETVMLSGAGRGKPMSHRTLTKVRMHLKTVFREAVQDGLLYINPMEAVKPLRQPRGESVGVALDFPQMTRFHELGLALYDAGLCRLFPALFTAASLGLRRGEVMALRWQDVDFEKGVLYVRQNITTPNGKVTIGPLKTAHSRRDVPLPVTLHKLLLRHLEGQQREQREAFGSWNRTGPVFATALGTYPHVDNLHRSLTCLVEWSDPDKFTDKKRLSVASEEAAKLEEVIRAGGRLPDLSPHDLRHTAATLMLRRGMPVEVVSRILGHAKVSLTLDIYRHVLDSETKSVMVDLFDTPLPDRHSRPPVLN